MPQDTYRIRQNKAGTSTNPYYAYVITLPARLVNLIRDWKTREFRPKLVDAQRACEHCGAEPHHGGILLEVVTDEDHNHEEVPTWAA